MKRFLVLTALTGLMLGLLGCGKTMVAGSVRALETESLTIKNYGEESTSVRRYTYGAPTRMDNGLIRLEGTWSEGDDSGTIILFYLPSGVPVAQRRYTRNGDWQDQSDYVFLADRTAEDYSRRFSEPGDRQGDTIYYSDGGRTELFEEGDVLTGYDGYNAAGELRVRYRGDSNGMTEEYYLCDGEGYEYHNTNTFTDIPLR